MAEEKKTKPILVVGSVNADTYIEVERLPSKGETIHGAHNSGWMAPGGKGANQAVCAALLSRGNAAIACQFGTDTKSAVPRDYMNKLGVDLHLAKTVDTPQGQAFIFLMPDGENSIIITGGSNAAWPEALRGDVQAAIRSESSLLLLQREIPDHVNLQAAKLAHESGVRVILDVGGLDAPLAPEVLQYLFVISPNETELARITGLPTHDEEHVIAASRKLQRDGAGHVLVKLGARGSLWVPSDAKEPIYRQGILPVKNLVDTTGAGDAFTAGFAVAVSEGKDFKKAMLFGAAAASVAIQVQWPRDTKTKAVQTKGAMPSMPTRDAVEKLLKAKH